MSALTTELPNAGLRGIIVAAYATTAALPAGTYANGVAGVGATFTVTAHAALPAQDGVTPVVGDVILVKDQASGLQNGVWVLTVLGTGSVSAVLTRHHACDTAAKIAGCRVHVLLGTTNGASEWSVNLASSAITVGTTALSFVSRSAGTLGPTSGNTASRPGGAPTGYVYFDTDLLQYIAWTGSSWINFPSLTYVTASFVVPAVGATVNVSINAQAFSFKDKDPVRIGKNLFTVAGTPTSPGTFFTVKNTGSSENVAPGGTIAAGTLAYVSRGATWSHVAVVSDTVIVPDSAAATLLMSGLIRPGAGGGGGGAGGGGGFGGATGGGGASGGGGGSGGSVVSQYYGPVPVVPGETIANTVGVGGGGSAGGAAGAAGAAGSPAPTYGANGTVSECSGSTTGFIVGMGIVGIGGTGGANTAGGNPGLVGAGGAGTAGGAAGATCGLLAGGGLGGAAGSAGGSAAGGNGVAGTGTSALNINGLYCTAAAATTYCLAVAGGAAGSGAGGARGGGAGGSAGGSAGFADENGVGGQAHSTNTTGQGGTGGHGGAADGNAGLTAGGAGTAGKNGRGGGGGGSGGGGGAANPTGGPGAAGGAGGAGSDGIIVNQIILP